LNGPVRQPVIVARPAHRVGGVVQVPGDKSISHRALLLGAVANGTTRVSGFLRGDDCLATLGALRAMGVLIDDDGERLTVHGVGMHGLAAPSQPLDLGNSGTGLRLLAGLLAPQTFDAELTGDASLRRRPMERIATPLRAMGADIVTTDGTAPLRITGGRALHGIDYELPVPSAQIKSAILLAGLWARGRTTVRSPGPSRDHTERMLLTMGVPLERSSALTVTLDGPVALTAVDVDVPGDFSSAAFFIVAGLLAADDGLLIERIGINPTRTGLIDVLREMGGHIELRRVDVAGAEPVADIFVRRSELSAGAIGGEAVALSIDELPILFIAAAHARGITTIAGAEELRHKESDRIATMVAGLRTLGVNAEERPDGAVIEGATSFAGGSIESCGDHRVAMAFAIASLCARDKIVIRDTAEVATSFPGFVGTAARAGLALEAAERAD